MNKLTKFSRAIFAIAMMLTMTTPSFAYSIEVDGIYYNIKDSTTNTVSVTLGDNEYSGKIIIPEYVVYNNVSYEVTSIGSAFNNCSNLTSIIIGKSVTSI